MGGGTEGRKEGRTEGRMSGNSPCYLQDIGTLGLLPKIGGCFLLNFLQCFTISLIDEPTVGQINHWKNQQTSQETKPLADIQECISKQD